MKIIFEKIKSFIRKFISKKVSYEKKTINPRKDWNIMLIFANIVALFFAVYAFYVYLAIKHDEFISVNSIKKDTEIKLNTELLKKIVKDLNDRSVETTRMQNSSIPPDPSI